MKTTVGLVMVAALLALGTAALADEDVTTKKREKKQDAAQQEIRELEAQIEALTVRLDRLKAEKKFAEAERTTERLNRLTKQLDVARGNVTWDLYSTALKMHEYTAKKEQLQKDLADKEQRYADAKKVLDEARARLATIEKQGGSQASITKAKDDLRTAELRAASLGQQLGEAQAALRFADSVSLGYTVRQPKVHAEWLELWRKNKEKKKDSPFIIGLGVEDKVKPGFEFTVKRDKNASAAALLGLAERNRESNRRASDLRTALDLLTRNRMHQEAEAVRKQLMALEAQRGNASNTDVLAEVQALRADVQALRQDVAQLKALIKQMNTARR